MDRLAHLRRLRRERFGPLGISVLFHSRGRSFMIDHNGRRGEDKVIEGVVAVDLRIEEEANRFVGQLLDGGR